VKDEEKFRIAIGKKIREYRNARGISQETLGLEVDLSKNQIGRIERGGNSTISSLYRIAKQLEVDITVLLKV